MEIASTPEERATVKARAFGLCAGGVENARILLYSNRVISAGIGNDHDVVRRYFMDHPRDMQLAVRLDPTDAAWAFTMFGPQRITTHSGGSDLFYGLALSPDRQHLDGLLNCAALPDSRPKLHDPVNAAQRLVTGRSSNPMRDTLYALSGPGAIKRAIEARRAGQDVRTGSAVDRIGFVILSEQVPDPDSRITLSDRRDRLGLPISQTDWRIGALEVASQVAFAKTIQAEFRRLGAAPVHLADWVQDYPGTEPTLVDGCHPWARPEWPTTHGSEWSMPTAVFTASMGYTLRGARSFPRRVMRTPPSRSSLWPYGCHLKARLTTTPTPAPSISDPVPAPELSGSPLLLGTTVAVTGATGSSVAG